MIRVQDVRVGAATTFERLFVDEYPKLVALGVAVSGDRELARDLAQEAMIRAHGRWDELSEYDSPGAWLRRVMSNLLIDHHRSVTAGRAAVDRLAARPTAAAAPEAGTGWADLVAPLSTRQRIVATLYYAEDRSVDEIAGIIGVSAGTVKSTLSKARRRLRNEDLEGSGR